MTEDKKIPPLVFLDRKIWEIAMIRRDDTGQHETSFFVETVGWLEGKKETSRGNFLAVGF